MSARLVSVFLLAVFGGACTSQRIGPAASPQPISARVDSLSVTVQQLRYTVDSLQAENDSLRRERADLQLQLLRLKHIDTRMRAGQP